MALSVSHQPYEIREILLSDKPMELKKLSAKATVPVMQLITGKVLEQSLDIMYWALKRNDPQDWLNSEGGNLNEMRDLIEKVDKDFKFHLDRYKYSQRYENVDIISHRTEGLKFLEALNERLKKYNYLFSSKPTLADYAIVPFVRQFANTDRVWFDSQNYRSLHKWLNFLLNSEIFIEIMKKYPLWHVSAKPIICHDKLSNKST